jgi:hypothetical protein
MDKETGLSKRFGFARFASVEHARAFVEPNFPNIMWSDPPGVFSAGYDGTRLKVRFPDVSSADADMPRRLIIVRPKNPVSAPTTPRPEMLDLPRLELAIR